MRKAFLLVLVISCLSGCAATEELLGTGKLETPPEFNQKIMLQVSDEYVMHQAPRSKYDIGDLQSFHTQHTLPITIEGAFKEMFGDVQMIEPGAKVEAGAPDVPAVFEVRIIDLANDIYNEATTYRAQVVLAVAMKSPRDNIFWQQSFRGEGFARVDPQFAGGLGPEQAVTDALQDAIDQMQKAIISSPQVRLQLQHYQEIEQARREKETKV